MNNLYFRAKAPLRLGLGGGGTDIPSYSAEYGGAVLNATISMYAYAHIEPLENGHIRLNSMDRGMCEDLPKTKSVATNGALAIQKAVYNRIVSDYVGEPLGFCLTTWVDAPPGSGLGSSSTLVVAIIGAFAEWLKLPLGEYDIAQLAYRIERQDLRQAGGKQDQYAASFGGFNFMEFNSDSKVIVNPLRIKNGITAELEQNILLYYTSISRYSSDIIEAQIDNVKRPESTHLKAMHALKDQAFQLKEAILIGQLGSIGEILNYGWEQKKKTAVEVSNPQIDEIYQTAIKAGATGGKISGAGGGGFFMFYCPGISRYWVVEALNRYGGEFRRYQFTNDGLLTWSSNGDNCR
jgi:D-glycero-alpha-D-manno-heptose-7-phosphate kinase